MRSLVVDEEPVFQVLSGVGEVDTVGVDGAAGRGIRDVRGHPHDLPAEGHHDVAHRGVPTDDDVVLGQVEGVLGPFLEGDEGELGAVADEHRDQLRQPRRALVLEDDDRLGVPADGEHQVAPDRSSRSAGPEAEPMPTSAGACGAVM